MSTDTYKLYFKYVLNVGTQINSICSYNYKLHIVSLCLLIGNFLASANIPNHYIIAFDQSIGNYRPDYISSSILKTIDRTLSDNGFDRENDYLSMVAYTMEMGNPSMERFVRPYVSGESTLLWKKIGDKSLADLFSNWPLGQPLLDQYSAPFGSMQSLAKPYIVMETKEKQDTLAFAGKTYLLLVSDEVVNGTDDNYAQEWNNVSTSLGADYNKFRKLSSEVFETMQNFNEEFKFVQVKFNQGDKSLNRIPISADGMYKIIPYEVVSVERPSIHAISDIPSPLPLQRVRGGFRIDVDAHTLSPKYEISKVQILDSKGTNMGSSDSGKFDIILPSSKIAVGDSLIISLSIILKDGLYNGVIITPENPRYHDGMTVKQAVKIQDEAKVLGILPLADSFWWWFPNDIFSAVMVWDLIILLILIVIIGYTLYRWFVRINAYKPSNDKLKITKI